MSKEKDHQRGLNRRDFMKATGGAAAMAGIAAGGIFVNPEKQELMRFRKNGIMKRML